ncbi:MAG TPA: MBL fold metallo-hydrolase [Bryobacteraceae bacterium]|jgi:glyoxylase-like metal-dependent hydrolase (beta-lactamase superfamily II)
MIHTMKPAKLTSTVFTLIFSAAALHAQTDYTKVEIKTTKMSPNFYTLEAQGPTGDVGGAMGVLAGPDGVLMVDANFVQMGDKVVAAVRKISDGPIRFVINTHVHGDHTGGDEALAKAGAVIMARDELRFRLAHPAPAANGTPGTPAPAIALPMVTYRGQVTFHMNGEDAEAIPILAAHTDGDTLVYFPNNDIIMTGDFFRSLGYPNIDLANGGSLKGMLEGLGNTIGMAGPKTKIIPGHGVIVDRAGLTAHRDMILAIRDKIAPMVQQGKTVEQVIAAKPTAEFDARIPTADTTSERFIRQVYTELKTPK